MKSNPLRIQEKDVPSSFTCNGTGIIIATQFSLPIPIAANYCTVNYEFFTEGGDISFSLNFIGYDGVEQVINEPKRVISDTESIFGSCEIDCPGTLIFLWDNTYSWFNNKSLTYGVEIKQDDIESVNRPRVKDSRVSMGKLHLQQKEISSRLHSVTDEITTLSCEVTDLEETIERLKREYHYKKKVLKSYGMERKDLSMLQEECTTRIPALGIRMLNNYELACVLQYLDISIARLVCKYWNDICTCEYVEGREAPRSDYAPIPNLLTIPPLPSYSHHLDGRLHPAATHQPVPAEIIVPSPRKVRDNERAREKKEEGKDEGKERGNQDEISSLSDDNHIGRSCVVMKKRSEIERYLEEIRHAPLLEQKETGEENGTTEENITIEEEVKKGLDVIHLMEKEKREVKEKIAQWKRHFEKKYHRQPSDEEKIRNIPGLFQKYSILNRQIGNEQQKLTKLMRSKQDAKRDGEPDETEKKEEIEHDQDVDPGKERDDEESEDEASDEVNLK